MIEGFVDLVLRNTHIEEDFTQKFALFSLLPLQGFFQLLLGDDVFPDHDLADVLA